MSNEELKPCPFCSNKNVFPVEVMEGFYILCGRCKAGSGIKRKSVKAQEAWNKRT